MNDELGTRMKEFYENRTRYYLPRRSNIIIRIDGKAFHTYTKGLKRPFDEGLIEDMDNTAAFLCKEVQGAKFAYVQSDEISIYISDKDTIDTQAWFDYNIQKMASVSASLATSKFNQLRCKRLQDFEYKAAQFDSRVFQIPEAIEVENYFIWRQQDCTRNSIQSVAQSLYSQKELHGKGSNILQELIFKKGINWNDYDPKLKRGRFIQKKENDLGRSKWVTTECPVFTQEREFLANKINVNEVHINS